MLLLKQEYTSHFLSEICCMNDENLTLIDGVADLAKLLNYSEEEIKEKSKEGLLGLIEYNYKSEIGSKIKLQLEEENQLEIMLPILNRNGQEKWIMCKGCRVEKEENEYIYAVMMDLTYTKKNFDLEQEKITELELRAQQDSLTQIYNAATCRKLAEEYLESEENCALFILDIDCFKKINDQYGHMFGDVVIIQAAQILRKFFRTNDILGRVGGDEFMVLMKDIKNIDIIEKRCRQLNASFREELEEQVPDLKIGLSIGVSLAPLHGNNYLDLFLAADQALYHAKGLGGRQYEIYSEESCGPLKSKIQMQYANYDKNMLSGYID